jgi:hypothetical protein
MTARKAKNVSTVVLLVLCVWYFTMLCVLSGVLLTTMFIQREPAERIGPDVLERVMRFDALHYRSIVTSGYQYEEGRRSSVAFFPAYPLMCRLLALTGVGTTEAMLIVANGMLVGCVILFAIYLHSRPGSVTNCPVAFEGLSSWAVVAFLLLPPTFFLRMPYAESSFCFFALLTLYGLSNRWPLVLVCLLAGLATATRPVGVAVSAAVWLHVLVSHWNHSDRTAWIRLRQSVLALTWVVPLSCWGLVLYALYLWWNYDAPFAFAQTQAHWNYLAPRGDGFWDKTGSLLTLEPIRGVFDHGSTRWWVKGEDHSNPLFSLLFWNPIYFLATWLIVGLGLAKRWLTGPEVVMSVMLLLIPYLTRSYEMSMASHARFSAVVLPQYVVIGRILVSLPPSIAGSLCGLSGLMLGLWTALFSAGYRFF